MVQRLLVLVFLMFFVLGGYLAYTAVTLPNVRRALEEGVEPSQTTQILARDKTVIMAYGKFQHKPMPLSEIPPTLIDALLATEDRRFYQHKGIDPFGIARALIRNVRAHGVHEGGSTLTQQLARNIFLSNERSLQRKIKEAMLAIKLEQQLTKDQILELYLNNIYFGEGAYGIGAASNIYFGKIPKALSKAECALLAGLPQAPSVYSPFANMDLALKRRNEVIQNLVEVDKLSESEANRLSRRAIRINPGGRALSASDKAPFFNRYVMQEAMTMLDLDEQSFWNQGLKIYTTLDPRAQAIADTQVWTLSNAFGRTGRKQQAALLSLDANGGMMAYVGGKDFGVSQYDRVSQARRLAGSLFKVFVYTTAIKNGVSPLTVYKDAPVTYGNWTPENYDKGHHGYMTLAQALAQSNNIVAVKLLHDLTPEAVMQTAQSMGVRTPMQPNLSLALGAADVTLLEMTGAFNVLRNNGLYIEPYAIKKITDRKGHILYQHEPGQREALKRVTRDTMVSLMQGVIQFGTGRGAAFGRDAAGKTGTSDDYRDAWFVGYTPEVTTGVWVGNDDNSQMPGVTGGSIPARIWRAYMSKLLSGMPKRSFDLAYALPVEEKDFFVYNLANLSASEGQPPPGEENPEEVPAENMEGENLENPEPYSFLDGQPPPDGSGEHPQPPEVVTPHNRHPIAPQAPEAPVGPTPGPSPGTSRFFNNSTPQPERFRSSGGAGHPSHPRYVPEGHPPGPPRPIVDPVGAQRYAPRPFSSSDGASGPD